MTTLNVSRGRGRIVSSEQPIVLPRRPASLQNGDQGQTTLSSDPTSVKVLGQSKTLITKVKNALIDVEAADGGDNSSLFTAVVYFLCDTSCEANDVTELTNLLVSKSLQSTEVSFHFSSFFKFIVHHKSYGSQIRTEVIFKLQEIFNARNGMSTHDNKYGCLLRDSVRMLGDIYLRYTIGNGHRLPLLGQAMAAYLEQLAHCIETDDLKELSYQPACPVPCEFALNGEAVLAIDSAMMHQVLRVCRSSIVDSKHLDAATRRWLLLALDLSSHNYTLSQIPAHILEFYELTPGQVAAMTHPPHDGRIIELAPDMDANLVSTHFHLIE